MAGIFDVGVSDVVGSNVSPQTPPAPTKNIALGMLAGAVGVGAEMFVKNQELEAKKASEAEKNRILADVNDKLETISQGRASGKLKRDAANMQISALNKSVISAYPGYTEDIQKFFNTKLGASWAGGIVKEKDESEITRELYLNKARELGKVPENASDIDLDYAVAIGQEALAKEAQLKATVAKLSYNQKVQSMMFAGNSEARAQVNQQYKENQREYTKRLLEMVPYHMDANRVKLGNIYDNWVKGGRTEEGKRAAMMEIGLLKEADRKMILEVGKSSPEVAEIGRQTGSIFDTYGKMFATKTEEDLKILQDEVKKKALVTELVIYSSMPVQDQAIALASKALPQNIALQNRATEAVATAVGKIPDSQFIAAWAKNANPYNETFNPYSKNPSDEALIKTFPVSIVEGYKDAVARGSNEEIGEYNVQMNSYLKSLKQHMGSIERPADLAPAIKILSDPEVGKWLRSSGADPEAVNAAKSVYQTYYRDEILKNAENMLTGFIPLKGSWQGKSSTINVAEDIEPILVGDELKLVRKGMKYQDQEIRDNENLKQLSNALNNFLKVSSNLEGQEPKYTLDNLIKPYVFGIKEEEPKK